MPEDSTKPLGPKLMNLPEGSLCDLSLRFAEMQEL